MSKIVFYVFSGTDNTYVVSKALKAAFAKYGARGQLYRIQKSYTAVPPNDECDFVVLCYPIHAFNAPKPFYEFVGRLKLKGRRVLLVRTCGEPFAVNKASSAKLIELLEYNGCEIMGELTYLMPYNIMFSYPDKVAALMYDEVQKRADADAYKALCGRCDMPDYTLLGELFSDAVRAVQQPGAEYNGKLITVDSDKCTGCGLCAKNCPQNNITMLGGSPRFGGDCCMCMSCVTRCPRNAVNYGILKNFAVNGGYDYKKLSKLPTGKSSLVGYYSLFKSYFNK